MTARALSLMMMTALSCVLICGMVEPEDVVDEAKAAKVKAAYLYNFAKFVTWPSEAFGDTAAPIVIGVLDDDDFVEVVRTTIANKKVGDRPVVVKSLDPRLLERDDPAGLKDAKACSMLYFGGLNRDRSRSLLSKLKDSTVLTVGDDSEFAEAGGMIGFVLSNGKIGLQVNRDEAEAARLKISANLLKLVTIVKSK
jgi:hypothetical protein